MVTVCTQPGNGLWFCKRNATADELRRLVRDYPKARVEIRNDTTTEGSESRKTHEDEHAAQDDYPHVA